MRAADWREIIVCLGENPDVGWMRRDDLPDRIQPLGIGVFDIPGSDAQVGLPNKNPL